MRRAAVRIAIPIVVLLAAAVGVVLWGWTRFGAEGPLEQSVTVVLDPGFGLSAIAERLEAAGVIAETIVFMAGARLTGAHKELRAGEYTFSPGVSPERAMADLVAGKTVIRRLTLPEGLTSAEAVAVIEAAVALAGEISATVAEGSLLPETYHYTRGDERTALIARMQAAMTETLDALWAGRAEGLPLAAPYDAVVLASIVEKETGQADERALIAGVFFNRLAAGMPLQSDPTVVYALTNGNGPLDRPLTRADLAFESPFNTYRHKGLPPGPIANPGVAALVAALHPAATDA